VHFPGAGDQMISEWRIRFSLEQPGPIAFAIRAFGYAAPAAVSRESLRAAALRCKLLPVAQAAPAPPRPRGPDEHPAGVGDIDGCSAAYNDLGCFINGDLQLYSAGAHRLHAHAWLTWTGIKGDDLGTDEGQYRLLLEELSDGTPLRMFSKGDRGKGKKSAWEKYLALVAELARPRYRTLTLGEASNVQEDPGRVTVLLRRDMDLSMYGALQMAEYEHQSGQRVSYLLNMASSIYGVQARNGRYKVNPMALENLHHLRLLGHEIGYQNDGLVQYVEFNTPIRSWMAHEIGRLRRAGLPVSSETPNGSPYSDKYETWNGYLYAENRSGGTLWSPAHRYRNGSAGTVTATRKDGKVSYPLPQLSMADAGFTMSAWSLPRPLPPGVPYRSLADLQDNPEEMVEKLREAPAGSFVQITTHDCRCTSWDVDLDFTVDPAFAKYYRDP
jgi:hypothetical protein